MLKITCKIIILNMTFYIILSFNIFTVNIVWYLKMLEVHQQSPAVSVPPAAVKLSQNERERLTAESQQTREFQKRSPNQHTLPVHEDWDATVRKPFRESVRESVQDSLREWFWDSLGELFRESFKDSVRERFTEKVCGFQMSWMFGSFWRMLVTAIDWR